MFEDGTEIYANWWCFAGVFPEYDMLLVIMLLLSMRKPDGWGYVNIGKPVSYDGYVHVLCFI